LRYKELESKVSSAGKDKQQGIDLYVIDLLTRQTARPLLISARTFRILSLEYEEAPDPRRGQIHQAFLITGCRDPGSYRTVTMKMAS
jgi:hypothetical protein